MIMLVNSFFALLKRFLKYLIPAAVAAGFMSILLRPRVNPYLGKSLATIIPKDREAITLEDLQKLNRQQLVGVFHQLVAPEVNGMKGEYRACLLDSGNSLNRFLSMFTLYFIWGAWIGKAFEPLSERHGHGYNPFSTCLPEIHENVFRACLDRLIHTLRHIFIGDNCQERTVRIVRNKTHIGPSMFDNRTSFHLVYRDYNAFPVSTMHDEVRKVNDTLFLGLGILIVTGGRWNIFPFVLIGPPEPWRGPDAPYPGEEL
jgi:hypothetical protein